MTSIGDLVVEFKESPGAGHEPPVLTLTERNGFVRQADRFNKRLATEDVSKYKIVRRDDIAFNPYLLWAGAVAQNTIVDEGIISPLYPTFRAREGYDPRYIARLLLSPQLIQSYDTIAFGSVPRRRRSSVADFLNLPLPKIPTLPEQRRIAAILDHADALRDKRRQALTHLDTLTQSIFHDMFGNFPKSVALGHLASFHSGGTPSKSRKDFWIGSVPWFSAKDLKTRELWDSRDHIARAALKEANLKLLPPNTITLVVRGMILAHTLPVTTLRVSATINQDLKALIPSTDIDTSFLAAAIRARAGWVLARMSTAAHGTKKLESSVLSSVPIPAADLGQQRKFATLSDHVDEMRREAVKANDEDEKLFTSLQSRAFRGEL